MADIKMERKKRGPGWLWALLALILIALVLWWLWGRGRVDEPIQPVGEVGVTEPVEPIEGATEPAAGGAVDLGPILANPGNWVGRDFPTGEVQVAEVATDRGFWVTGSGGERLFGVIIDQPAEQPKDINAGQTLRITGGTLRDSSYLPQLAGDPLDDDTRRILENQEVFLVVDEADIEVVDGGQPPTGTDPAQGFGEGAGDGAQ